MTFTRKDMDAVQYLSQLKATSAADAEHLDTALVEYEAVAKRLSPDNLSTFAGNVLCMMCRNLEKCPEWSAIADPAVLIMLCVRAMEDASAKETEQQTRLLASAFHIHRYATRHKVNVNFVLKISHFVFKENPDNLLKTYAKTYWALLVDKIMYIEQLKTRKHDIKPLIPVLRHDVKQTVQVYPTIQFCIEILNSVTKKLFHIFNEWPTELNEIFSDIFKSIHLKKDLETCAQNLKDNQTNDIYRNVIDCFNVIVENSSKNYFKSCALVSAVQAVSGLFKHRKDLLHCLSVFYTKFPRILIRKSLDLAEILAEICEEKHKIMREIYPYFNQVVRTHVELLSNGNEWIKMDTETQKLYIELILKLMEKLKTCTQVLKCINCKLQSGLHDALRLSFSIRTLINLSLKHDQNITTYLPQTMQGFETQMSLLRELEVKHCTNVEKFSLKVRTDLHNTGILLYRHKFYNESIRLFRMNISSEIKAKKTDKKALSRSFYNKAICELDLQDYQTALKSAYLSLVFNDDLNNTKHLSLVIDIKSRASKENSENDDAILTTSVLTSCMRSVEENEFGDLKQFLKSVQFSVLLQHEASCYSRMWPAHLPFIAVAKSLLQLASSPPNFSQSEGADTVVTTLGNVILTAACSARTIQHADMIECVNRTLQILDNMMNKSLQNSIHHCTLLLLKSELEFTAARNAIGSTKIDRKSTDNTDSDEVIMSSQTLQEEHEALQSAERGVRGWNKLLPTILSKGSKLGEPTQSTVHKALSVCTLASAMLVASERHLQGLQLARLCCRLAILLNSDQYLLTNAGVLLESARRSHPKLEELAERAAAAAGRLLDARDEGTRERAVEYMCQEAMYRFRTGRTSLARHLVEYCRLAVLSGTCPAGGAAAARLLAARSLIDRRADITALSVLSALHRASLCCKNTGNTWTERRLCHWRHARLAATAGLAAVRGCARVLLVRRARAAAAPALRAPAAAAAVRLHAEIAWATLTASGIQVRLDTIRSIIGGREPNEAAAAKPTHHLTVDPSAVETVRDVAAKKQNAPASPYFDVKAFCEPDMLTHLNTCKCYACSDPRHPILALELCGLEAAYKYRNEQIDIAQNYFEGTLKMFDAVEMKAERAVAICGYEEVVREIVSDELKEHLVEVKSKILLEYACFCLAEHKLSLTDECLKRVEELNDFARDAYLVKEIQNLKCAAEYVNLKAHKRADLAIEERMRDLKLSPTAPVSIVEPKTPTVKVEIPKMDKSKVVVNVEELPTKRRVIKLNLDDTSPTDTKSERRVFKVPVPKTSAAVPEPASTRRSARSSKLPVKSNKTKLNDVDASSAGTKPDKPKPRRKINEPIPVSGDLAEEKENALITKESLNQSPDIFEEDKKYYTPISKPEEQFFTPMSTVVKTYAKKSLRHKIVKNLEHEFQSPLAKTDVLRPVDTPQIEATINTKNKDNLAEQADDVSRPARRLQKSNIGSSLGQKDCDPKKLTSVSAKSKNTTKTSANNKELRVNEGRRMLRRATSPGKLEK